MDPQIQRLYSLVETLPHLVWTASADGRLLYANSTCREWMGDCEGRFVEKVLSERLYPEDQSRWMEAWLEALRGQQSYEIEYRLCGTQASGPRWFLERGVRNTHAPDESETWFITSTLIDQQHRREDEARLASLQEERLVATVLHELRAPLAPIRYATDVLAGAGVERVDWACRIIRRQVQFVTRLVDDLADVASILRGGVMLRREALDLRTVIESAIETALPGFVQRGHDVRISQWAAPLWVLGDAGRLAQVAINLFVNAAKYTTDRGKIEIATERVQGSAILRVRDNGIGIEAASLERIFDWFQQGEMGASDVPSGCGIGLALAREFVTLHHGTISARSEGPGQGSEFIVKLPLHEELGTPNAVH
jgi:signal transduction histidine kinase